MSRLYSICIMFMISIPWDQGTEWMPVSRDEKGNQVKGEFVIIVLNSSSSSEYYLDLFSYIQCNAVYAPDCYTIMAVAKNSFCV